MIEGLISDVVFIGDIFGAKVGISSTASTPGDFAHRVKEGKSYIY